MGDWIPGRLSGIRPGPDGRGFVTFDGQPFFLLGDTLWELFRAYQPEEVAQILRIRARQGFNTILIMLTGAPILGTSGPVPELQPNLQGQLPWIDYDPHKPNEAYFRHVDRIIRQVADSGMVMIVGVYHKAQDRYLTPANARAWARWVSRRHRDVPNLIWCMYPTARDEWKPVCHEIAAGLSEGDDGAHLITMHPDPAVASSSFMHEQPWLAFNMIQTCVEYDQIVEAVSYDYSRVPPKPVIMAEGGYEGVEFGKTQTAHDIRKQAWWTHLAGGYFVYGHNDCWVNPTAWRHWIESPGARQMKAFATAAQSVADWWQRVPESSLIVEGAREGHERNMSARDELGRWVMAYVSAPGRVRLRLDSISARSCELTCVRPADGARISGGQHPCAEVADVMTPDGWEDTVIVAQAV